MTHLDYIDDYFRGVLPPTEKKIFDQRISDDSEFADEVFFYIATLKNSKDEAALEKKKRFEELYVRPAGTTGDRIVASRKWWPYVAAAVVIVAMVIVSLQLTSRPSLQQQADNYIAKNLTSVGVQMSTNTDSLQLAKDLFNQEDYQASRSIVERQIVDGNATDQAFEIAGLSSLHMKDYETAVKHFKSLSAMTLFANPGKFYHALTLIKRNVEGDQLEAKRLLQQVVDENLEGKETAAKWLKHL